MSLKLFCLALAGFTASALAQGRTYRIGEIPPLEVLHGTTLEVQLTSAQSSSTISHTIDAPYSAPTGFFSSTGGRIRYTPSADDKFSFSVTFVARSGNNTVDSQSVLVKPIPRIGPESDLIGANTGKVPDPESRDYVTVTQQLSASEERFNSVRQRVRSVQVTGKTLVLEETPDRQALFSRLNNKVDIKTLTLFAEKVVVRSALKLPGTNVTIWARELEFQDAAGVSKVDTTPNAYPTRAGEAQNGLLGQNGGDITLRIQSLIAPSAGPRFVANGGRGQDAGQGKPGLPKSPLPSRSLRWGDGVGRTVYDHTGRDMRQSWGWVLDQGGRPFGRENPYPAVVAVEAVPANCGSMNFGQKVLPADGENATPPGVPGPGGNGGVVDSTVAVPWSAIGGPAGAPGDPQKGGPPQSPAYAVWLKSIDGSRCTRDYFNFQITASRRAVPGRDAPSVAGTRGRDGGFKTGQGPWLHSNALRMIVAHAKDAYRDGNYDYPRRVLETYGALVPSIRPASENESLAVEQLSAEIAALVHRIGSNVDYFGNPAGWVPMLSLEANMRAFESEIDPAIQTMYLSYWLQRKADELKRDVTALSDAVAKAETETSQAAAEVNKALDNLPGLQLQVADVATKIDGVQNSIAQRQQELLRRAEQNVEDRRKVPAWRKSLGVLSVLAQAVPVGQPALGAAGTTIQQALPLIDGISSAKAGIQQFGPTLFSKPTIEPISKNFAADLGKIRFAKLDGESYGNWATRLKDSFKPLHGDFAKFKQVFQGIQSAVKDVEVSDDEVRAEFEKLKGSDGLFGDLAAKVNELNATKVTLVAALSDTLQTIAAQSARVEQGLLTGASLATVLGDTSAILDAEAVLYVKELERGARDRLLKYQYYMAKAYEYRMLKPYPGNLGLNQVVDRIIPMLDRNYTLRPEDFASIKAIYVNSVRDIISRGIDELQQRAPERSLPFRFELTSAELAELNARGEISIDLASRIAGQPNEENRHIADFGISDRGMEVRASGASGPFGRVRVIFEHQGFSVEVADGRAYRFGYGSASNGRPFTWGASFDLTTKQIDQEKLSVAGLSLICAYVQCGSDNSRILPFVRPAADAVIRIRKVIEPASLNADVTRLSLFAAVDFHRTSSDRVTLDVSNENGASPYFVLNRPDVTGRTDGRQAFRRVYRSGETVQIVAEPVSGERKFVRWADERDNTVGASITLSIVMNSHRYLRAVYEGASASPPGSSQPALTVSDAVAVPGRAFELPLRISTQGATASAGQVDVEFDPAKITFTGATRGESLVAAAKDLNVSALGAGKVRLVAAGINQTPIKDGVLALLNFRLDPSFPPDGKTTVACTNGILADVAGRQTLAAVNSAAITAGGCTCDINRDGAVNVVDVQSIINQVLGTAPRSCDLNGDGRIDVADVQVAVNAVLGLGCGR